MEIPGYLKILLFAVASSFIIYAIEPPPINIISAPISNFTNVSRSIQYTVQAPDNITKLVYFYGSVSNMSKYTNMPKIEIVQELLASRVFVENCTGIPEKEFGDPYIHGIVCTVFGETYWLG